MRTVKQHISHFDYNGAPIEFCFWSNTTSHEKPDVIIFLGAGQTDGIARMVAERAGHGVVVVGGVPHWHAHPDAKDIEDFTKHYFESAYQSALAEFDIPSMHIIAESQAAPAAIVLGGKLKQTGDLALIRPLGFSVQAFGQTPELRLKAFRKRILRTLFQYPQSFLYDPRNFWISLIIVKAMLREPSLASLNKKYIAGISYDAIEDLHHTVQVRRTAGNSVSFILGERDKMFPPDEITAALKSHHISHVAITVIPGASHSYLASRASRRVLTTALETVRKKVSP